MSLSKEYFHARRVGTPIIGLNTADQPYTMFNLLEAMPQSTTPALTWDIANGLKGLNAEGKEALIHITGTQNPPPSYMPNLPPPTTNPITTLRLAQNLPPQSILFCHNAHVLLKSPEAIQAIANLRNEFKQNGRTLTLMGPNLILPPELQHDIILISDPLPTQTACATIVTDAYESANIPNPDPETVAKASEALHGLSPFAAEQITALSLTSKGLHLPTLWKRKHHMINHTPGLQMWEGDETFANIGGVHEIKRYLTYIFKGKRPPKCIVFLDEIEKQMAGSQTQGPSDNTGVAQAFHGEILAFMQDTHATGLLFTGPQGTCKSHVSKAAGHEFKVPTISMSLSSMKTSLVGASESNIHQALATIRVLADGAPLFIGTCNAIQSLSPELRRRFRLGTFFFDLPTQDEKDQIWKIYHEQYQLPEQPHPTTFNWSGSDIQSCAELAWRLDLTINEASQYIIPTAQTSPEHLQSLRQNAHRRFLSASYPGPYQENHQTNIEGLHSSQKNGRSIFLETPIS